MEWHIDCYKKNKIVNRIDLIMNEEDFVKMLAHQVIFYQTHDLNHTEIHNLRQYDRIAINGNIYYDLLEFIDDHKEKDIKKIYYSDLFSTDISSINEQQNECFSEVYKKIDEIIDKLKEVV